MVEHSMCTALVVDDDVDTLDTFCEYLENYEFVITGKAYDGERVADLYSKIKPDIVFLDLKMSNYDGFYALEQIRKANPEAIVIIVTGDLSTDTAGKLQLLRPSAVIYKPFDIKQVLDAVKKSVDSQRNMKSNFKQLESLERPIELACMSNPPKIHSEDQYRILLLEDNDDDAQLIEHELKKGQSVFNIKRVDDKQSYLKELDDFAPDLIISDYRLPKYDGLSALLEAKTYHPDLPVIIVSGAIGDDLAVQTIKNGATDYILKDKLHYLLPSVKTAIKHLEVMKIKSVVDKQAWDLEIRKTRLEIEKFKKELEEEKTKRLSTIGETASRFLHDLRGPLSVVKNTSEILKIKYSNNTLNAVSFNSYKTKIDKAVFSMSRLLDSALDFVRVAPLILSEVSLLSLVTNTCEKILHCKNIEVALPENDYILRADEKKLEVVLTNLLSNAEEAIGDKRGKITIRFFKTGKNINIEINDTGSGIPESIKDKIFEPLFTTKQKGTGLGLASCKNIIEQHRGKIWVESDVGRGTSVCISLPAQLNSEQPAIVNSTSDWSLS